MLSFFVFKSLTFKNTKLKHVKSKNKNQVKNMYINSLANNNH